MITEFGGVVLDDCHECGGHEKQSMAHESEYGTTYFAIQCNKCKMYTPGNSEKSTVIHRWNTGYLKEQTLDSILDYKDYYEHTSLEPERPRAIDNDGWST